MSWAGGDWICRACHYRNFERRESCQMCRASKLGDGSNVLSHEIIRPGDWFCAAMHHNYSSRTTCHKCGAARMNPVGLPGDWICTRPGCAFLNFACRQECYQCNNPRDSAGCQSRN